MFNVEHPIREQAKMGRMTLDDGRSFRDFSACRDLPADIFTCMERYLTYLHGGYSLYCVPDRSQVCLDILLAGNLKNRHFLVTFLSFWHANVKKKLKIL